MIKRLKRTADFHMLRPHLEAAARCCRAEPIKLTAEQWAAVKDASPPPAPKWRDLLDGALGSLTGTPIIVVETVEESTPFLEGWIVGFRRWLRPRHLLQVRRITRHGLVFREPYRGRDRPPMFHCCSWRGVRVGSQASTAAEASAWLARSALWRARRDD